MDYKQIKKPTSCRSSNFQYREKIWKEIRLIYPEITCNESFMIAQILYSRLSKEEKFQMNQERKEKNKIYESVLFSYEKAYGVVDPSLKLILKQNKTRNNK